MMHVAKCFVYYYAECTNSTVAINFQTHARMHDDHHVFCQCMIRLRSGWQHRAFVTSLYIWPCLVITLGNLRSGIQRIHCLGVVKQPVLIYMMPKEDSVDNYIVKIYYVVLWELGATVSLLRSPSSYLKPSQEIKALFIGQRS